MMIAQHLKNLLSGLAHLKINGPTDYAYGWEK